MNAFSATHLALAGFCVIMAVLHAVMWRALPDEHGHKWVTASFAGFAVLAVGIAGSSVAAQGSLGESAVWLALTVPTVIFLPVVLVRAAWAVLDWPMTRIRWGLLIVVAVLLTPMTIQIPILIAIGHPAAQSWEAARFLSAATELPYHAGILVVAAVWLIEGARAIESLRALAWTALAVSVPSAALGLREVALAHGWLDGPTLIGVVGLPLGLFASTALVVRYIQVVRSATPKPQEHYRQLYRLGVGGMGELWLSLRLSEGGFRRFVALKRIRIANPDPELVERFLAEARVAARLHHANIVAVYDLGRYEDGWFIVMEYLPGPSLWDILSICHEEAVFMPPEIAARIAEQVCRGLDCAHSHGVLHRDVSPDNVIVTFDGVSKILDFGIAKEAGLREPSIPSTPGGAAQTQGGGIVGKMQYLAPERIIGEAAVAESDVYSLGVVLVQLLGAPIPSRGADLAGVPDPVGRTRDDVPRGLIAILRRALQPHPKQRFRSAAAMAVELRALIADLPEQDLGGWVRRLCPRRWELQRSLAQLGEPDSDEVAALFSRAHDPTSDASLALGQRPAPQPSPTGGPPATIVD